MTTTAANAIDLSSEQATTKSFMRQYNTLMHTLIVDTQNCLRYALPCLRARKEPEILEVSATITQLGQLFQAGQFLKKECLRSMGEIFKVVRALSKASPDDAELAKLAAKLLQSINSVATVMQILIAEAEIFRARQEFAGCACLFEGDAADSADNHGSTEKDAAYQAVLAEALALVVNRDELSGKFDIYASPVAKAARAGT
ncbi:hypothetical protein QCN27_19690 [Cereibacter sp. SYSU M97828]|nr:hypothetical protein [Cereibacter flavus]